MTLTQTVITLAALIQYLRPYRLSLDINLWWRELILSVVLVLSPDPTLLQIPMMDQWLIGLQVSQCVCGTNILVAVVVLVVVVVLVSNCNGFTITVAQLRISMSEHWLSIYALLLNSVRVLLLLVLHWAHNLYDKTNWRKLCGLVSSTNRYYRYSRFILALVARLLVKK